MPRKAGNKVIKLLFGVLICKHRKFRASSQNLLFWCLYLNSPWYKHTQFIVNKTHCWDFNQLIPLNPFLSAILYSQNEQKLIDAFYIVLNVVFLIRIHCKLCPTVAAQKTRSQAIKNTNIKIHLYHLQRCTNNISIVDSLMKIFSNKTHKKHVVQTYDRSILLLTTCFSATFSIHRQHIFLFAVRFIYKL